MIRSLAARILARHGAKVRRESHRDYRKRVHEQVDRMRAELGMAAVEWGR